VSIWGKILGGAAGFALGGPLGAVVGLAAGHAVDKVAESQTDGPGAATDATQQIAFTTAVIVLGAKLAKADGQVTRDEIAAFKQVFHIPPGEMKAVGRVFDIAKKDSRGFEPYARQMGRLFADRPAVLEQLMDALFHIAKADNQYHPGEKAFLEKCADLFGFDAATFERIEARHTVTPADNPYKILGVDPGADRDAVKAAHRKLVRERHPDLLISQGVPEEFIDKATEELAKINAAYDAIVAKRGWK
jgi:DnaJ like chaperone protein